MSAIRLTWSAVAVAATLLAGCQKFAPNNVNGEVPNVVVGNAKVMKEQVESKSFRTGAAPKVVVDTFNGAVTVTRGEDGTVAAEVTKRGGGETEEAALAMLQKLDVRI